MDDKKTIVLIHGFHLDADDWLQIVWGDPTNGIYGRIPRGIQVARGYGDVVLRLGSGGSMRNGAYEAHWALEILLDRRTEIPELAALPSGGRGWLLQVGDLEETAKNTAEEVAGAFEACVRQDAKRLVLVSSPTHISRCLNEAERLRGQLEYRHIEVLATASDVSYTGYSPDDVVVVEPPHRCDLPQVSFHKNAKQIFQFLRDAETARAFNVAWHKLIERWVQKLP